MPTPAGESIPEAAVKHPEAILKPITFLLDSVLKEYETEKDPAIFGQTIRFIIEEFLDQTQDPDTIRRRRYHLNRCRSRIIDKLWEQLSFNHMLLLSGTDFLILEYLFCYYPLRLICLLVKKDKKTIITMKSRIMRIIRESDAPDKQLFLDSIMDYR